jgi:hypothetical protein
MFFVPVGIWYGTPGLSTGFYIWHSMIPSLIGNVIGGGVFVGAVYWYLFITGESTPISVDGDIYGNDTTPIIDGSSEGTAMDDVHENRSPPNCKNEGESMV